MQADDAWICEWLDGIAGGKATMSQRAVSSIERHGGLDRVIAAARERNVHLLQIEDDKGKVVVAASIKPLHSVEGGADRCSWREDTRWPHPFE